MFALAGTAAYLPVHRAGFVYDDHVFVEKSPDVHGSLLDIWVRPQSPDYWPVTWTSFWIESRLLGDDPGLMHATNVALHVLAGLLIWRILAALGVPGAALAGVIFVVHPVAVDSVAWIIQRKNTLSAVLYLASTLAWIRFEGDRRSWRGVASVLLFLLAGLAKTSGILLPVVLIAISIHRSGSLQRRHWPWIAAFILAAVALGATTVAFQWTRAMPDDPPHLTTVAERVAGAAWAWVFYVQKAFVPTGLASAYPEWPVQRGALFYLPVAALSGLGVLAWLMRHHVNKPLLLALGYHLAMVLPLLGLVDTTYSRIAPVANAYQYLALVGPVAVVSTAIVHLGARAPRVSAAFAAALVAVFGAATYRRAAAFEDDFSFWRAAARDAPLSMYAALRYNDALLERARREEAARELAAFVERSRDPAARHRARGVLLFDLGLFRESTAELLTAHALRPTNLEIVIGGQLIDANECASAVELLSATVESMPRSVEARYLLGTALMCGDRAEEAVALFRRSLELLPGEKKLESGLVAATLYAKAKLDEDARAVAPAPAR